MNQIKVRKALLVLSVIVMALTVLAAFPITVDAANPNRPTTQLPTCGTFQWNSTCWRYGYCYTVTPRAECGYQTTFACEMGRVSVYSNGKKVTSYFTTYYCSSPNIDICSSTCQ